MREPSLTGKGRKKTLRTYRNCFMTQLAFFIVALTSIISGDPGAGAVLVILLLFEILFYGYSVLLLRLADLEERLEATGIIQGKGERQK